MVFTLAGCVIAANCKWPESEDVKPAIYSFYKHSFPELSDRHLTIM